MYCKIKNLTHPNRWGFEPCSAPAFPGTKLIITDSDILLAGDLQEGNFETTDLFLVSKNRNWIKRFVATLPKDDIYVQITPAAAVRWLFENGYLSDPDHFDLEKLLNHAMKYEPEGGVKKERSIEFPSRFYGI